MADDENDAARHRSRLPGAEEVRVANLKQKAHERGEIRRRQREEAIAERMKRPQRAPPTKMGRADSQDEEDAACPTCTVS